MAELNLDPCGHLSRVLDCKTELTSVPMVVLGCHTPEGAPRIINKHPGLLWLLFWVKWDPGPEERGNDYGGLRHTVPILLWMDTKNG